MNENLNTIKDIPFRIMSTECLLSRYFGISVISLHQIIIDNNRKSTSYDLIVYNRNNLTFRKNT